MRLPSLVIPALSLFALGACSKSVESIWRGDLDCNGIVFDFEFELEKERGLSYEGDGEQIRSFTNADGMEIEEVIEFDMEVDLDKATGAQALDATLTCILHAIHEDGFPRDGVSCDPLYYHDFELDWDGKDAIDVVGPNGCSGTVER